jgi:hypothetical protein
VFPDTHRFSAAYKVGQERAKDWRVMKYSAFKESPRRKHAADALRRARKLPVGHSRNDLRQLAMGLLGLDKQRFHVGAQQSDTSTKGKDAPPA